MEFSKYYLLNHHGLKPRWVKGFVVGVFLPLLLFLILASHVWQHGKGFVWDIPILQAVHATARPALDILAQTLTPLGVFWCVFPMLAVIGCVLLYRRNRRSLAYLVITPLGSYLLNHTIKLYFHRERPQLWEVFAPDLSYAFPICKYCLLGYCSIRS